MTVYAITDTKNGEQGLRLLIFKLPTLRGVTAEGTGPHRATGPESMRT